MHDVIQKIVIYWITDNKYIEQFEVEVNKIYLVFIKHIIVSIIFINSQFASN